MLLLLGLCLTSSLLHSVQMLQCLSDSSPQNSSLVTCPGNQYCGVFRINSVLVGVSVIQRACVPAEACRYIGTITSFNVGSYNATFSCCNTDGCNNGNLPEHYAAPNGLKCESCNSPTEDNCNTTLSCVGIQECCIKDFSDFPFYTVPANVSNYHLKGCGSKNLCVRSPGNLGNKSTAHNFSFLLLSLSVIFSFNHLINLLNV